jgi:hypothetical protein
MQVGDAPQFAVGIARRGFDHGQSVEKGPSGTTRWWRGEVARMIAEPLPVAGSDFL